MARLRYVTMSAALILLFIALPHHSAFSTDFQEMLVPLQLPSEGEASPEGAASSHVQACITRSPRLFSQNLLLGVCDGSISTINKYAECLHVTTFKNGDDVFSIYDLPARLQEETVRAVATEPFDTADEDVAHLLAFAGVSSYYGAEFRCVEVAAEDAVGVEYRLRVVVGLVNNRWYAMPRCRSSNQFYEIADAMPLAALSSESFMMPYSLMIAAPLVTAVQFETEIITPDTMAEYGFSIECRSWETSERDRERRSSAEVGVRVRFDPEDGPMVREFLTDFDSDGTLVVRDGDSVLLTSPVDIRPWGGNYGGLAMEFTIQRDLLDDVELVLQKDGIGTFTIDVDAFLENEE